MNISNDIDLESTPIDQEADSSDATTVSIGHGHSVISSSIGGCRFIYRAYINC